ncbi:unnamed protein product, partial [Scytosiphon promiscuus]
MRSAGSNVTDDESVASNGGAPSGGKPKLRRVESLNSLKEEGDEYGGGVRGRSFTAASTDPDALGLDLAAVVTHLKEDGLTPEKFQKSLQRNHHRTSSSTPSVTASVPSPANLPPKPSGIDITPERDERQRRPPLWGVFGWIGDVAKVVTGQGGGARDSPAETEIADDAETEATGGGGGGGAEDAAAAAAAEPKDVSEDASQALEDGEAARGPVEERREAGPELLPAEAREGEYSPVPPLSPRERKAS